MVCVGCVQVVAQLGFPYNLAFFLTPLLRVVLCVALRGASRVVLCFALCVFVLRVRSVLCALCVWAGARCVCVVRVALRV